MPISAMPMQSRSLPMVSFSIASNLSDVSFVDDNPEATMPAASTVAPPPSPSAPEGVQSARVEHHAEHYYASGDVRFLVGDTLYQLHADILERQSHWYRAYRENMTDHDGALPAGWHALPGPFFTVYVHPEGKRYQVERPSIVDKETGAIVIEGVKVEEMDSFLAVLYPRDYVDFGLTSLSEWIAVLKVAHKLESPAIRALVIDRLDGILRVDMTPFTRLVVARHYGIESWLAPALAGLVVRGAPLEADEIAHMLPEDVARVASVREDNALLKAPPPSRLVTEAELAGEVSESVEVPAESYATASTSSPDEETPQVLAPAAVTFDVSTRNEDLNRHQAMQLDHPSESRGVVPPADPLTYSTQEETSGENLGTSQENELTRPRRDSAGLRTLTLPGRYSLG
ncbi:hypothetical protein PENSPDRAFT_613188 [Peniophora sp. CONT]|nr:hypothetical protein PENSPDRAFT_613188 [Peniophora sp. CONT]